ncbi:hypothetical protein B0I72DRAFT_134939 [Yarrowia lipolytica]|jgi:hypothetical protein|uniref:Uncharacterized protein n=1 Tax=Yarrowia lipolytica TaxID=4952 RepID=A0A371CD14_YARLL|nr:hypothetical protein BKA91DRAFT_133160 [Yarrowia lipolytica]KAE8175415.1 hypothetical protein BKA90DRAFT_132610 [Yarrowia lipolytica]RDW28169.1 hypothetical protein B0I71DRAFT_127953 [Yarrowia lipolytica]RDW34242.1 hypothetical protein B0I72DRAFT_134939 [Yarrowia lipolytica]RDW42446.1 hypothetical protein B0I73DRAFT_127085 [Yarrowia lipolytica]
MLGLLSLAPAALAVFHSLWLALAWLWALCSGVAWLNGTHCFVSIGMALWHFALARDCMDLALHLSLNDLHLADGSGMACSSHSSGWSSMAYLVGAYCCLHGSWRIAQGSYCDTLRCKKSCQGMKAQNLAAAHVTNWWHKARRHTG